jgi:hypothetical protein
MAKSRASMQGYRVFTIGPFITVRYKGLEEASMQGYGMGSEGPS